MAAPHSIAAPLLLLLTTCACAQLPTPSGLFGVGRVTLTCEDSSRIEPVDPSLGPRRIVFDVWYPASRSAPNAAYLNIAIYEQKLGGDALKKQLGASYEGIKAGRVTTHAAIQAPFTTSLRLAPLLLFSPGGGMIRELYTAQLQDLASHGYIVAAMTHSYDGFLSVFPDGNSISYDSKRWPKIPSLEGEANLNQLEWHTGDILAVLHYLTRLNSEPSPRLPFAGHIDLTRIGAFGHSFGGVAAAHACQKDQRIRACLNQDGAMAMKPFYLDARGWGMDQAFMFIERPPNRAPLTDLDLAELKLSRPRAMELIARLNADRAHVLRRTGKGSYRVLLERSKTAHIDFSDLPVLSTRDEAEFNDRTRVLTLIQRCTRDFFDKYVRDKTPSLIDRNTPDPLIESIERFPPGRRQN